MGIPAGLQTEAVFCGSFCHARQKSLLVRLGNCPQAGERGDEFLIDFYETENTYIGIRRQFFRHFFKTCQMVGNGVLFSKQDGVISPTDVVLPNEHGKLAESLRYLMIIGNARFHVLSIAGNGDIKKGRKAPSAEFFYIWKHRRRVFGTEYETVHHIGVQPVAVDFMGGIGAAGKDVALMHPVHEPFAVAAGNIGSGACIYEHR